MVNGQLLVDQAMARTRSDEDELELAVREHARLVYRVAYSVLRNHHDAEDATQEAFVRVVRYRRKLAGVRDPRTLAGAGCMAGRNRAAPERLPRSRSMTWTRWFDRFVPWRPGQTRLCWGRK